MSYELPQNDDFQARANCAELNVVNRNNSVVDILVLIVVVLVITSFGTA